MPTEQISIPIQRRAASVVPDSVNDKDRTVDVVWTTGAEVRRYDWARDRVYHEELEVSDGAIRLDRLNNHASVLDSHMNWRLEDVIGVTEKAWIDGGEGKATLRMMDGDEASDALWHKIKSGFIRHISVGYAIHQAIEIKEDDKTILRATDWEPQEISFVPVGADAGAGTRSENQKTSICNFVRADDGTSPEGETMAKTVEPKEGENANASPPADDATRNQPNTPPAAAAAEPVAPTAEELATAAQRSANDSALEIMEACNLAGVDGARAADFMKRGVGIDIVRKELLEEKSIRSGDEISGQHQGDGAGTQTRIDHQDIYKRFNQQEVK